MSAEAVDTWANHGIDVPAGASGELDTTCPECSHKRKKKSDRCLSVNADEGTWFCHHCGWSGGLKREGGRLAPRPKVYARPAPIKAEGLSPEARKWLQGRGISVEVAERNGVSSGTAWMPQTQRDMSVIRFPYFRGDELINVKYRDGKKNFRMEKGAERILYGLNDLADEAVLVEGEIDKLSVEVAGITSCVSVPDGAPTPNTKNYASKFDFLDADEKRLRAVRKWILAVDNDEPGVRLKEELARRLGREKCYFVTWPEGCKDANDVLVKFGATELARCIREAKPFPIEGTFTARDLHDRIERLYDHGFERGVSTGWPRMDRYYTVRPGEFTVVTGIPNSGKSNWLDALLVNLARLHGWGFAMFSPENQPLEDHMSRIMEKWADQPFDEGPTPRMNRDTRDIAEAWVSDHFTWMLPEDDTDWTIDSILERARQLVYRKGITGIVIDPWNELEDQCPPGVTETQYISQSLKRIRQFGRRHSVHVWVVVHPAKLYKDKDGNYPVPTLYDCAGSAHWRNKADNGICVWRDFGGGNVVEIHVQKIRFRQIGQLGMVKLRYQAATGTYQESL